MPRIGRASYRTPRLVPGGVNAKAVRIRGDRNRGPRFRRGRLRGEHLHRGWQRRPQGQGLEVQAAADRPDVQLRRRQHRLDPQGLAHPDLRDRVRGARDLSEATSRPAPSLRRRAPPSPRSARRRRPAAVSCRRWSAQRATCRWRTACTATSSCTLYNISGAGSQGGMAIRLDTDPPPRRLGSRTIGCPTPVHQSIKAKFVKTKIGGLASSELRFTVPTELLHPAGLDNVVQNNESLIDKWVAKKKGKQVRLLLRDRLQGRQADDPVHVHLRGWRQEDRHQGREVLVG